MKEPAPCGPGPWGGDGGRSWDDGVFSGIKQIYLTKVSEGICSIQIEYDRNRQSVWSVKHGGSGGDTMHRVWFSISTFFKNISPLPHFLKLIFLKLNPLSNWVQLVILFIIIRVLLQVLVKKLNDFVLLKIVRECIFMHFNKIFFSFTSLTILISIFLIIIIKFIFKIKLKSLSKMRFDVKWLLQSTNTKCTWHEHS